MYMLQWGRNFIVAEMRLIACQRVDTGRASMGPQLYRCGNAADAAQGAGQACASMGPQLYRCGNLKGLRQTA